MDTEELTRQVIALDERTAAQAEQIKTCFTQIAETKSVTDSVYKLVTTVEILARELQSVNKELKSTNVKIDKVSNEVEEIKEKPAKRWDNLITLVITAIVTAVMTYFLTKLGMQ